MTQREMLNSHETVFISRYSLNKKNIFWNHNPRKDSIIEGLIRCYYEITLTMLIVVMSQLKCGFHVMMKLIQMENKLVVIISLSCNTKKRGLVTASEEHWECLRLYQKKKNDYLTSKTMR